MSRRSYASVRSQKNRFTDEDVFNYVLRTSYLAYLMQPKAVEPPPTANRDSHYGESKEREYVTRMQNAVTNSIISIGDLFKDSGGGPKSVKYPEKLLKVIEQKLQNIAMGKDPNFSDQLIRRTIAVFYGTFTTDSFKRQMKDSRKIEDLILMFVTTSTGVLKKDPSLSGDSWKVELNNQIAQFVTILRDSVRQVSHSPELAARLDMYAAKLAPSATPSDSGYDSASVTSRDRDSLVPSTLSAKVVDMPLVLTVARLFGLEEEDVQKEVNQLKKFCTEAAALSDLKTCLKNINAGAPFPGKKEDFESDAAWQQWRTTETSTLSQLMLVMVQFNPELAKSAPSDVLPPSGRPESVYSISSPESPRVGSSRHASISSRYSISMTSNALMSNDPDAVSQAVEGDDEVPVGHHFTYIPPNPRKFYKRLVEICVKADLEAMAELLDDQEVSLGILSAHHLELINECAVRWRIGQPYRVTCFVDVIKYKYEREEVPMECIPEALTMIQRAMNELDLSKWPRTDQEYIASVYGSLFNVFLSHLYQALDAIPNLKQSEVAPFLTVLEQVRDSGLLERFEVDITARLADLQERVRTVAIHHYTDKMTDIQAAPGVNRALPLLLMTDVLEKNAKTLDKRFPEPILGQLDLVALVVEAQFPLFFADLDGSRKRIFEGAMNGPTPDVPVEDIFALYRRTKTLMGMFQSFCPNSHTDFDLLTFFEPYVRQWLVTTDNKTTQWVQAAIAADKFQPEGDDGNSSSIVDLFESLRSPISFLQELEWLDEYQEARFYTSLSKTISKGIEQYCRSVEELFMAEMFPRVTDYLQPQKSSAWLEKARQLAITNEKKVEPFNFQPDSCVKLNNVEAARKLLDNLYAQMEVDKITEVLENHGPAVPEKVERPRFLFTVKVTMAEGLVPLDSSPSSRLDTFVTLSDEEGNRMAKTRTIYETLNPRWEETFDISVEKPLWLMVSIRDRALVGKHDTVGRAYICLDPRRFGDLLTHDLWLDLDSQGRILLRVSMEGEKDDIQFYFGRAFRSLKRAEGDMVRIFIDKMTPFVQQSLSRSVVKSLVKTGTGLDYNKALGNVTAFYQQALGKSSNEVHIPLPDAEKPRVRPGELTDVEIEAAIVPLFDYFDANLQTLNTYLSDVTKEMVMTRLWKEIVTVIESLLVPPLSDVSSDLKPLSDTEVDIVFKWLKFLRDYFYAGGEGPVPLESLQNPKYDNVVKIRFYYDWDTDSLMEECVRMMQQNLRAAPSIKKRAKSVYSQRNLGTIKDRKREKKQQKDTASGDTETIMRILRMRPHTTEFIAQQLQIMARVRAEQEQQARETQERKAKRRQVEVPLPPLAE